MQAPVGRQHAPVGTGQMNGTQLKAAVQVNAQLACDVTTQKPVAVLQQAPGHALGLQLVPAPIHDPFTA